MTQPSVDRESPGGSAAPARVSLRLEIEESPGRWLLEEQSVPETPLHDGIIQVLLLVLQHWASKLERSVLVTSNLGCRWDPSDARVGADPDVVLVEPAPPEGEQLSTLRIWEPGHSPPRVAIEVVSANTAEKDYLDAPARCARLGVREVWVFDPLLQGPATTGGPFVLQVWRANGSELERQHAGATPAWSEEMDAWLVVTDEGARLRLASDRDGEELWPTRAEAAEAEVERLQRLLDQR